jgi:hypothetical protein
LVMLIGLSVIATANNGFVIPFTGISIGGIAGEPAGTLPPANGSGLLPMSARSCMIRDPLSCAGSQGQAGATPGLGLVSNPGGGVISLAGSPIPVGSGNPAVVPNDPAQSQGQGDGDGIGGGRNHR